MEKIDFEELQKHINILNVAYHLCLEVKEQQGYQYKAICPFCSHRKLSKIPTLTLDSKNNKYICSSCGEGGFSVGLYAKMKNISKQTALIQLLEMKCYSEDREQFEITPINQIADIKLRDAVYRKFL